jgi:electron transfer flavoprotein beta subunit
LNIVVLVKQVPDMNAVKIDRTTGKPVMSAQQVVSSYDLYAIEEALRLKEKFGGEVIVISVGAPGAKDAIIRALSMGADRGLLLTTSNVNGADTLAVARLLADQLRSLAYDVILAGQTADDNEDGQVGPQLAELLSLPLVSSVFELQAENNRIIAKRDMEDGHQIVATALPAVILASTGPNEPRLPSLKGIMGAKKKPFEEVPATLESSGDRIGWGELFVPARTVTGTILQDVPPVEAAQRLVAWMGEQKLLG